LGIAHRKNLKNKPDEKIVDNHYGSAYEKTKRRANTLVGGRLLPESMKAASKATIQ